MLRRSGQNSKNADACRSSLKSYLSGPLSGPDYILTAGLRHPEGIAKFKNAHNQ